MEHSENSHMEIGKNSSITSKLNALLRLGLVSKNNVRRALTLFADPEKAMKNPAYRLLMQEILVDVVDRILNNRTVYSAFRTSLARGSTAPSANSPVSEGVEKEREKVLLKKGLVDPDQVLAARRALSSKSIAKSMGSSKVYRDMMITMMDSMVKKITGSPVLFNAFKATMGKDTEVDESFLVPSSAGVDMFWLDEDVSDLLQEYKPSDSFLWAESKMMTKELSDNAIRAVKLYNERGGEWSPVQEGKTFSEFSGWLEENDITEGEARISRKEVRDSLRWLKQAEKDPKKHNLSPEDIKINRQAARDRLRKFK